MSDDMRVAIDRLNQTNRILGEEIRASQGTAARVERTQYDVLRRALLQVVADGGRRPLIVPSRLRARPVAWPCRLVGRLVALYVVWKAAMS